MKFEDLKLPDAHLAWSAGILDGADNVMHFTARVVYDQMHAHYEAKLAEANMCPQELLEYVQHFFKVAQQGREAGERLRAAIGKDKPERPRPQLSEQTQKEIERLWPEVAAAICEACGWQKPDVLRETDSYTATAEVPQDFRQAMDEAKAGDLTPLEFPQLEPEELFEHPDMPGKKFRRLKPTETVHDKDFYNCRENRLYEGWIKNSLHCCAGLKASNRNGFFYREVPQPAPAWRLPEPEELFEHPDMPGKKFRRLKVGEVIQHGDWIATKGHPPGEGFLKTVCAGLFVESGDGNYYYREVPQPAPEWRLPDPPPGQQWHRTDWTQDMLPEGYVPLEPGDVPPGTVLRGAGEKQDAGWCLITSATLTGIRIWRHSETNGYEMRWRDLMDSGAEILRPNSTTWEPCKKPKP